MEKKEYIKPGISITPIETEDLMAGSPGKATVSTPNGQNLEYGGDAYGIIPMSKKGNLWEEE
ncbi:MAG: hypothetical protein PUE86_11505 [Prevotella sp.]|nr:hypothetical protein [Prevotella sp.]